MCMCTTWISGTQRGQKRVEKDTLELELLDPKLSGVCASNWTQVLYKSIKYSQLHLPKYIAFVLIWRQI